VAAPQLSYVHALSHLSTGAPSPAGSTVDHRQQAPEKACDSCLSLAHLADALPAQHAWAIDAPAAITPPVTTAHGIAQHAPDYFNARAPPSSC
jgi:hypothetical protein